MHVVLASTLKSYFSFAVENRSNEEFLEVCPTRTVPAIDDDGFRLFDRYQRNTSLPFSNLAMIQCFCSAAIMKYLVSKYNLPDHWYPGADLKRQAKVDEYLHWHHIAT